MSTLRILMQAVGTRCLGGRLPDAYLVIDVETSGMLGTTNPNGTPACVAQFGVATVLGRRIVHSEAFLVQRAPGTMQPGATKVNRITDEMLATGMPSEVFYPRLIRLLTIFREKCCPYVGHNIANFDMPFINVDLAQHGFIFAIKPHELIDTGMIYKANQMCVAPRDDESLSSFFKRVSETRSRVKWNLALTMRELHLDSKFGLSLADAHDAGFDCRLTHLLFEELRQLAIGAPNGY